MIVNAMPYGQLGNRLVLYAHLISVAAEYGVALRNPAFGEYAKYFVGTAGDAWCRYPSRRSLFHGDRSRRMAMRITGCATRAIERCRMNPPGVTVVRHDSPKEYDLAGKEFADLVKRKSIVILHGWLFRNRTFFIKHGDAIRAHLAPVDDLQRRVDDVISRARGGSDVLIGVHIRQGDYLTFEGGKFFWPTAQYAAKMRFAAQRFPGKRVRFLICSDTKQDPAAFAGCDVTMAEGQLVCDLYSLARCDYVMGRHSTFSMWASFYGKVPLFYMHSPEQEFSPDACEMSDGLLRC